MGEDGGFCEMCQGIKESLGKAFKRLSKEEQGLVTQGEGELAKKYKSMGFLTESQVPMEFRIIIFDEVNNLLPGFREAVLKYTDLQGEEIDKVLK